MGCCWENAGVGAGAVAFALMRLHDLARGEASLRGEPGLGFLDLEELPPLKAEVRLAQEDS